jgi:hypothetical protein
MYWLAHLVYLVSPFQARLEPIDWRFLISLTGLRMIDISMNFMYLNAAWWYFSMLIQLYLLFPLLYMGMRKSACGRSSSWRSPRLARLLPLTRHAKGVAWRKCIIRLPELALGWWSEWCISEPGASERWLGGAACLDSSYYFALFFLQRAETGFRRYGLGRVVSGGSAFGAAENGPSP